MPATNRITVSELDKLIADNLARAQKTPKGPEYDRLKRAHEELVREKDRTIKATKNRLRSVENENLDLKKRLERQYNNGESPRNRDLEDRRNGTAGDAQKELDRRNGRSKNPPRGNLKPGDLKPGEAKRGQGALEAVKEWDKSIRQKATPVIDRVNSSKLGNFVKNSSSTLAKAGDKIARSPVGKVGGAAYKILGPISAALHVGESVKNLFSESPIERNIRETSEFKDGVEAALTTIIIKQNRMRGMLQALAQSNTAVLAGQQQLMEGLAILAESIDTIEDYSLSTKNKVNSVNFAAIKNSADEAAKIAKENKVKLGAANFTLHNQAAQLAKSKLEILDATQIMAASRLAEKKWNILDATQLMATSRLAEKKWNILDATQLMATSRLAEKKWNILDATQLMTTSRLAEAKWGLLDVTQIMRYSRSAETQLPAIKSQLTKIEAKVGQPAPVNLTPVLSAINAIPSKFPAPLNLSGLTTQIVALSNQITGVNNSIQSLPSKINTKAPDLTPVLNAITNIRIPAPQPTNLTPVLNAIDLIPSKIPSPKPTDLSPVLSAIGKIPTPQPIDLSPILGAIAGLPGKIPAPNLTPLQAKLDNISGVVKKIDKDNEEQKTPTTITVKVWDSARNSIGVKTLSVPKPQAEAIKLLADEAAEAQEDSHKDRAEKKSALQKIGDRLKLNQIFSALNTILTVHNAAMLATNLTQTVGELISNGLAAFGLKDDAGNDLDINSIVGKQIEALLKQILGEEVYNGTKLSWQKASRVVSTAANVAWTIQSIADSTRSIMEMTAENTGRIGNALKKYRVVGENAYAWMPEDVTARTAAQAKIDKLIEGLSDVENAASSIGSVVSEIRSIQSEVNELKTQREDFKSAIEQAVAPTAPPENQPIKVAAAAAKTASTGTGDIAKTTRDQAED